MNLPPVTTAGSTILGLTGTVINGQYRLEALVGTGPSSAVYQAVRLDRNESVAVKLVQLSPPLGSETAERLVRDLQSCCSLKHPNAAALFDFGFAENGLYYLATELISGQSLRQIIYAQGALSVHAAVGVIAQVSSALDAAHRQGLLHLDLKPENIMIASGGEGLQVKVLDLGAAELRSLSVTARRPGDEVRYLAPEQSAGGPVDQRTDIYGLGLVAYEMLGGRPPFSASAIEPQLSPRLHETPLPLRSVNSEISLEVQTVVMRALGRDPQYRQRTAGEFAGQLGGASSGVYYPPAQRIPEAGSTEPPRSNSTAIAPTIASSTGYSGSPAPAINLPLSLPTGGSGMMTKIILGGLALVLLAGGAIVIGISAFSRPSESSSSNPPSTNNQRSPQNNPADRNQRPTAALRKVISYYTGVNVRKEPRQESDLLYTLGKGDELWLFRESGNVDTFPIKSKGVRQLTDNWSEVELISDPSIHGWVWSAFLKP